ncbi:MAG: extracellular solute-binding protein, partial [Chloroflexi bacterium]|nr:extracellular solute-binding protein [Chloroflexota bacterium]
MSKQMRILLVVTAVSLVLLVACGGEPSPTATQLPTPLPPLPATAVPEATAAPEVETPEATATAVETPEEPVTITWWTEPIGGDERRAFEKHVIEGFNAAHPGIVLEVNVIADLDRVTRTAVQGGEGPDIIQSPGPAFMVDYINAGHVLPLDDYAAAYGWADTIYPWAMDSGRVNGHLYSLPLTYETMVLFYNTTLFDEMGWEAPADQAGLEALAEEAADAGILPFAHGNASWRAANEWYVTIFYNNYAGSQAVYEALTGQRRWDDPMFVEAIQALKDYMDRGWFSGGREIYYSLLFADVWGALGDGSAAMQMVGTWGFLQARTYFEGT